MKVRNAFIQFAVMLMTTLIASNAFAGQKLKIYLETNEHFTLEDDSLLTGPASIAGRITYKIKKFKIKKSGDIPIASTEEDKGLRDIEIYSDTELKINLKEVGLDMIVPATIVRDDIGQLLSIHVSAEDYMASLNPLHDKMDSKLFKMAKSKILKVVPFDFRLKASDLDCEVVEVIHDDILNKELQCVQIHYVDIAK